MIADRVAAVGFHKTARPRSTKFDLRQDADRIVDLDTEISDDAFQRGAPAHWHTDFADRS
jgi:hypothetical protein